MVRDGAQRLLTMRKKNYATIAIFGGRQTLPSFTSGDAAVFPPAITLRPFGSQVFSRPEFRRHASRARLEWRLIRLQPLDIGLQKIAETVGPAVRFEIAAGSDRRSR